MTGSVISGDLGPNILFSYSTPGSGSTIYGDSLIGDLAAAATFAGGADDLLEGVDGDDLLLGQGGNDSLIGNRGDDTLDGGDGADTAAYPAVFSDGVFSGASIAASGGQDGYGGNDVLVSVEAVVGGQGNDTLDFSAATFGATLNGIAGFDVLYGGAGNDFFFGLAESGFDGQAISGGGGADTVSFAGHVIQGANIYFGGSVSTPTVFFDEDIEGVVGSVFDDTINFGNFSADVTLAGNPGDDFLVGGWGDDRLVGGPGDDTLTGDGGADTASYAGFTDGVIVTGSGGTDGAGDNDVFIGIEAVEGGLGSDTIDFSAEGFDASLAGDEGDDSLAGGTGDDSLDGGPGADTLAGGTGNDTLTAGNSNDFLQGGDGNDVFRIAGGDNSVDAGSGDDLITGSLGTGDILDGGAGSDTLSFDQAGYYRITEVGVDTYLVNFYGADTLNSTPQNGLFIDVESFAYQGGLFPIGPGVPPGTILYVCFAQGTRILTDRGEVAVEALRPGDVVATIGLRGAPAAPVLWVGHRRVTLAGNRDAEALSPIRIRAGALGEATPHRDLLVSPDHCLFLDGALVPARLLVNGESIVVERGLAEVSYYHVELDRHDVLIAEGAAAESWLDCGNRAWFANAPTALLRVDATPDAFATQAPMPCAPIIHGGERLAAIRAAIALQGTGLAMRRRA